MVDEKRLSIVSVLAGFAALGRSLRSGWCAPLRRLSRMADAAPASPDYTKISPLDLVKKTPKGKLRIPTKTLKPTSSRRARPLFRAIPAAAATAAGAAAACARPLTNDTWVYGGDDDTLFRLVTLGSDELQKERLYPHRTRERGGPHAPVRAIIKNADDLWKILAFVRAHYDGDPGV